MVHTIMSTLNEGAILLFEVKSHVSLWYSSTYQESYTEEL
jgi:hypothetical protein